MLDFKSLNSKKQGDIGVGYAIAWLSSKGYTVSIPLTDLVVDINNTLSRVQVKTTKSKKYGNYLVGLRTCGGNQSWNKVCKFLDKTKIEYLFILTEESICYFIPTSEVQTKSTICLNNKYEKFKVKI